MRGILSGLLLCNVLYLIWGFLPQRNEPGVDLSRSPLAGGADASALVLVAEADPADLLLYPPVVFAPESEPLAEVTAGSDEGAPDGYCAEIGPFLSRADADGFVETNSARFAMSVEVREMPAPPNYRVYIPPLASRELAVSTLETLRAAFAGNNLKIDTFLVPRGELENSIALGLFSEHSNALNVQSQLRKLGYAVVVRTEENTSEEVWVVVSGVESEAVFMQHWSEIQLSRSYIHAGEKLC